MIKFKIELLLSPTMKVFPLPLHPNYQFQLTNSPSTQLRLRVQL